MVCGPFAITVSDGLRNGVFRLAWIGLLCLTPAALLLACNGGTPTTSIATPETVIPAYTPTPISTPFAATPTREPAATPAPAPTFAPTPAAMPPPTTVLAPEPTPLPRFTAISSGLDHSCALREDGTAICWGNDEHGKASPPEDETFTAVSSGRDHTCGLREDGAPVCWGSDELGQTSPPGSETFTLISSGGWHACGLRSDGTTACWGYDEYGQASPPESERFTSISSGEYHTCGLRVDGTAICWDYEPHPGGWGEDGWDEMPTRRFTAIDSGYDIVCAIASGVTCWGSITDVINPIRSWLPGGLAAISVGWDSACGIRDDGSIACGGDYWEKASHLAGKRFSSISVGATHSCALDEDGAIACWGDNQFGQASPPGGQLIP